MAIFDESDMNLYSDSDDFYEDEFGERITRASDTEDDVIDEPVLDTDEIEDDDTSTEVQSGRDTAYDKATFHERLDGDEDMQSDNIETISPMSTLDADDDDEMDDLYADDDVSNASE